MFRGLWLLVTVGCGGVREDEFEQARLDAYCNRLFECSSTTVGSATQDDCNDITPGLATTTTTATACEFDRRAAAQCVAAFEDADCEDILDPSFTPDVCNDVCL